MFRVLSVAVIRSTITAVYSQWYNICYVVLVAVNCSYCTPDDGYGECTKHVE
jgi:hypothetical protein